MRRIVALLFLALGLAPSAIRGQTAARQMLDIYFIDTEGGHATLYVSPSGQSLLMDAGNPGERDLNRILAALDSAGVKQIDYLVLTHYHTDHVGGVEQLAKRIPIAHFIDHGPTVEPKEQVPGFQKMYAELYSKASHTVVKPGDTIPIGGLNILVVTSAGRTLKTPLPGAGEPNAACASFQPRDESHGDPENAQSLGLLFTYGKFRTINLGDLTWNAEHDLMCPNNPIGTVDLYLTSHHGLDQSGSEALVHGIRPRVAVMHNGQRKGAAIQTFRILYTSPGLENLWQLHWGWRGGVEWNTPGVYIANIEDPAVIAEVLTNPAMLSGRGPGTPPAAPTGAANTAHTGPAFWIKASARSNGSFTVLNTRNGFAKTYASSNSQ